MRNIVFGYVVAACVIALGGCHRNENYVVEVSGHVISTQEFTTRYKSFLSSVTIRDNILTRKQVLNNMINEILIIEDMKREGRDRDSTSLLRLNEIRRLAVLLRYAQRIALDTMTITEGELQDEFRRYNTRVHARYVYATSEDSAWALKDSLDRGTTFYALAKTIFEDPGLANNGGDLGYFGWNEMDPALEEFTFNQPVGTVSDPIKLRMGYAIVKIENRVHQPLSSESDYEKVKEKLAGAIQKRKIVNYLKDAADKIRRDISPTFNEDAIARLLSNWSVVVGNPSQQLPEIAQGDISTMRLVTFRNQSWTIGEFFQRVADTKIRQRKRVKTLDDLKEFIIGVAVGEVTYQRAMAAGMERDSTVQDYIKRQTEEYLLKRWRSSVQDTVGVQGWDEAVLRKEYEKKKSEYLFPPEINVAEILLRTKADGENILRHIRHGSDFASLARKHSLRLWSAKQGGELGFGAKTMYGPLADTLFSSNIGSVLGPLHVDPYWGIFKILAKHAGRMKTYEEARQDVIKEITFLRQQEIFKGAIASLQQKSKIVISDEVLSNIVLN